MINNGAGVAGPNDDFNWNKYPKSKSVEIKTGDVVTIHLDLDDRTLGYSKNDEYLGIAFENVKKSSYRLAISMYHSATIQLMTYYTE